MGRGGSQVTPGGWVHARVGPSWVSLWRVHRRKEPLDLLFILLRKSIFVIIYSTVSPRTLGYLFANNFFLKRHGPFMAFKFYCKIMLCGINYTNYNRPIAYRPSKDAFMYHLRVENSRSKGTYSVYLLTTSCTCCRVVYLLSFVTV